MGYVLSVTGLWSPGCVSVTGLWSPGCVSVTGLWSPGCVSPGCDLKTGGISRDYNADTTPIRIGVSRMRDEITPIFAVVSCLSKGCCLSRISAAAPLTENPCFSRRLGRLLLNNCARPTNSYKPFDNGEQFLRLPFALTFVDPKAGYTTFAVKLATYREWCGQSGLKRLQIAH